MGVKSYDISYDSPDNTYRPGQTVTGTFTLVLDAPKKIRCIRVRLKGFAHTEWTESESYRDHQGKHRTRSVTYSGHKEYFKVRHVLDGNESVSEMELAAGTHTYTFACTLPPGLPQSYEGEHGHIRYHVKVTIDRPWKFDHDYESKFQVESTSDHHLDSSYLQPMQGSENKYFCCLCCRSGPITATMHIPKTAYIWGEKIPITLDLNNPTDVEITDITLYFRRIAYFHSETPARHTKQDKDLIHQIFINEIEPERSQQFVREFDVAKLIPSHFINCNLINLEYEIKVEMNPAGAHTSFSVKLPIVIGRTPIYGGPEMTANAVPLAFMPSVPGAQPGPPMANMAPYPYPSSIPNHPQMHPMPVPTNYPPYPQYPPQPAYNNAPITQQPQTNFGWAGPMRTDAPPPPYDANQMKPPSGFDTSYPEKSGIPTGLPYPSGPPNAGSPSAPPPN